jgi:hypothetical protein
VNAETSIAARSPLVTFQASLEAAISDNKEAEKSTSDSEGQSNHMLANVSSIPQFA